MISCPLILFCDYISNKDLQVINVEYDNEFDRILRKWIGQFKHLISDQNAKYTFLWYKQMAYYYMTFVIWNFILNLFNTKPYRMVMCVTKLVIKFCIW
jgi:hypothetical protein